MNPHFDNPKPTVKESALTFNEAASLADLSLSHIPAVQVHAARGETAKVRLWCEEILRMMVKAGPTLTDATIDPELVDIASRREPFKTRFSDGTTVSHRSAHAAVDYLWAKIHRAMADPNWNPPNDFLAWLGVDLSDLQARLYQERVAMTSRLPTIEGEWMKRADAARRLNVKSTTIVRYVEDGKLRDNGQTGVDRRVFMPADRPPKESPSRKT